MITDEDYAELRKDMFIFKKTYPDMGNFLPVYDILSQRPIFKKLKTKATIGEIADALTKIDNEYKAITLAALDLAEALTYILSWRPKDWSPEKARDLGRAASAKAGISIPEPMNQEAYTHYVIAQGYIESGWEYGPDAHDQMRELREAGTLAIVLLKNRLDLDPWNNANWRNTQ